MFVPPRLHGRQAVRSSCGSTTTHPRQPEPPQHHASQWYRRGKKEDCQSICSGVPKHGASKLPTSARHEEPPSLLQKRRPSPFDPPLIAKETQIRIDGHNCSPTEPPNDGSQNPFQSRAEQNRTELHHTHLPFSSLWMGATPSCRHTPGPLSFFVMIFKYVLSSCRWAL
jgi:hypothetical protein